MKKILIIDGNSEDEAKVRSAVDGYDVSSVSYFDMNSMALSTVISIANTVDAADVYSAGRSLRVAVCARDIAENLGWDKNKCRNIYFVALLHDIGMITVDDSIVNKPSRLDPEEYEAIKRHPVKGAEMLKDITIVDNLAEGVLHHHERWDGKGYPKGLSQEEIPEFARVISIADAYDAMSSDRVYRSKLTTDKIISEFTRCAGSQFDPEMAEVFVFMLKGGYSVDPGIEQTKEASERASRDGGLRSMFTPGAPTEECDEEIDAITGLFTRSYLNAIVGKKITEERSGGLMIIDITGLSEIGGDECDTLIKKFSDRLKSFFREADAVCRMAADRFAVYVSGDSGKSVIGKKAAMIADAIDTFDEFEQYRSQLRVVIGIAMCMEDGVTFEELYRAATDALAEAKESGKSAYRFGGN
ncbi:MAG: HD domain-containing protein [Lachnospiraceae bacterium]|nr:HD domain-containing protein [Lachnospiraceae bacterium]